MWIFNPKLNENFSFPFEMITSPLAFPRLPPRINMPQGLDNTGKLKDQIVSDSEMTFGKLSGYHKMFQRHALGLFNMTPGQFIPGHPLYSQMKMMDMLREENKKLRQENFKLNSDLKEKKK